MRRYYQVTGLTFLALFIYIKESSYRSQVMSQGDFSILYTRPISVTFLAIALCALIYFSTQKRVQKVRTTEVEA